MPEDKTGWITVSEAAKIMKMTPRGVRMLIKRERLDSEPEDTPRGKVHYVREADAKAWKHHGTGRKPKENKP